MKNINTINSESTNVITCAECGCIIDPENAILIDGETYCEDCAAECSFCGEYHLRSEMTETEDGLVCEYCLDNEYGYCESCETWQRTINLNWCEEDEYYVCDNCLEEGDAYRRCDHCGDIQHTENLSEVYTNNYDSELWCDHCREYHANYCSECGREFSDEYVTVEDECCEYCETPSQNCDDINFWEAPRGVRSYGYKPNPCFCPPEAKNDICFGFELEMEDHRNDGENVNKDADYMNDTLGFTYCKHDGSLTNGIELVSHPATLEYLMERKEIFREVFNEMIDRGYTSHDNGHCGLHVHISLKPLLEENEDAVSNLMIVVDNLWDKLVRFSRRTESQLNSWASRYDSKQHKPKDVAKEAKKRCGRYMAINQTNKHTVEIRIFRGTLKADTFLATLQLVQRLVDVSIECKDPEKAYDITWEQITDCDYPELKAYCEKRFATSTAEADNNEVQNNEFNLTRSQMHRANLHVDDPIQFVRTEFINEHYIGATGSISNIDPDNFTIQINEIANFCPDRANVHVYNAAMSCIQRTSPLRIGDYVEIASSINGILDRGEIGIVRNIDDNLAVVEFSHDFPCMHDCDGRIQSCRGRYLLEVELHLI